MELKIYAEVKCVTITHTKKQRREMLDMQMKFYILCELYYCDKLKVHSVNPKKLLKNGRGYLIN